MAEEVNYRCMEVAVEGNCRRTAVGVKVMVGACKHKAEAAREEVVNILDMGEGVGVVLYKAVGVTEVVGKRLGEVDSALEEVEIHMCKRAVEVVSGAVEVVNWAVEAVSVLVVEVSVMAVVVSYSNRDLVAEVNAQAEEVVGN